MKALDLLVKIKDIIPYFVYRDRKNELTIAISEKKISVEVSRPTQILPSETEEPDESHVDDKDFATIETDFAFISSLVLSQLSLKLTDVKVVGSCRLGRKEKEIAFIDQYLKADTLGNISWAKKTNVSGLGLMVEESLGNLLSTSVYQISRDKEETTINVKFEAKALGTLSILSIAKDIREHSTQIVNALWVNG
jgi:hypothetical protein